MSRHSMRKFMIERRLPGIGSAQREELAAAAQKSNEALRGLGPDIQWIESYAADDKTYCVYLAKDETLVRRHAEISGFPADRIIEIKRKIYPSTASDRELISLRPRARATSQTIAGPSLTLARSQRVGPRIARSLWTSAVLAAKPNTRKISQHLGK